MNGIQTRHWVRVARSFLVDGFILVFAFLAGTLIRLGPEWANDGFGFIQMLTLSVQQYWPGMLLGGLFFPSAVYVCGLYAPKSFYRGILPRFLLLTLCLLMTFWILAALFYLNFSTRIGRGVMLLSILIATILVLIHHINSTFYRRRFRERCAILNLPQLEGFALEEIEQFLGPELSFCGFILEKKAAMDFAQNDEMPVLGTIEQLESIIKDHEISKILCNTEELADPRLYRKFCNLRYSGVEVTSLIQHCEEAHQYVPLQLVTPEWLLSASSMPHRLYIRKLKRAFDIVVSLGFLLFLWPLMLLAALGVLITSGRPILYRQERVGHFGRSFSVAKFRTMRNDAEKDGAKWSSAKGDSRVTLLGGFFRKYRIDELPQLLNILRGEMSFVGPRPERPEFVDMLNSELELNPERLMVQPGLTGWAQVSYPYGASVEDASRKLEYDLYYMKNMSLFLDLFILLDTVRTVLRGGATSEDAQRHNRYFLAALHVSRDKVQPAEAQS